MAILARTNTLRALLAGTLLCACAASRAEASPAPELAAPVVASPILATPDAPAATSGPRPISEEEAHKLMPRADLTGLSDEQRGILFDVAGDTFDYAGCNSTLAACLRPDVKDKHAPRMAHLAAMLIVEGYTDTQVKFFLDQYYGSFAKERRKKLRTDDCPLAGEAKAPVMLVEFSDYQCPHCARAVKPIHELLETHKAKVKLCAKYFPLPGHPRAMPASGAAEFAKAKGKFWQMHELLFANQERLEDSDLKGYAQKVGLDGDEMLKEIYAGKFNEVIEHQKKEGLEAGVDSTPSIFLDGRLMTLPGTQFLPFSTEDEVEWQHNGGAWDKE